MSWITPEIVKANLQRNLIYITIADAKNMLSHINQQSYYEKNAGRVEIKPFDGNPINGVDVTNVLPEDESSPKGNAQRNLARQFIINDTGLAYMVYIDGKLSGFQPHHPFLQGWHSMSSHTWRCPRGHLHENNCSCGEFHEITEIADQHKQGIVQGLASSEIQTKLLYMAQEIYDRRMQALDRLK